MFGEYGRGEGTEYRIFTDVPSALAWLSSAPEPG
jgi:hypothetical protein